MAHLLGSPAPVKIFSATFNLPGKWDVVLEGDSLGGVDSSEDHVTDLLNSIASNVTWQKVRQEKSLDNPSTGIIHHFYLGITTTPPVSPSDQRSDDLKKNNHSIDVYLRRLPLTMHPNWPIIKSKFNISLVNGQLRYPLAAGDMYNVQDFISPICRYQRNSMQIGYQDNSLPRLGKIDYTPTGITDLVPGIETSIFFPFEGYSAGYWLKSREAHDLIGPGMEINEAWDSGGIGGWSTLLYDIA